MTTITFIRLHVKIKTKRSYGEKPQAGWRKGIDCIFLRKFQETGAEKIGSGL
jgi:hypothetical protein